MQNIVDVHEKILKFKIVLLDIGSRKKSFFWL